MLIRIADTRRFFGDIWTLSIHFCDRSIMMEDFELHDELKLNFRLLFKLLPKPSFFTMTKAHARKFWFSSLRPEGVIWRETFKAQRQQFFFWCFHGKTQQRNMHYGTDWFSWIKDVCSWKTRKFPSQEGRVTEFFLLRILFKGRWMYLFRVAAEFCINHRVSGKPCCL